MEVVIDAAVNLNNVFGFESYEGGLHAYLILSDGKRGDKKDERCLRISQSDFRLPYKVDEDVQVVFFDGLNEYWVKKQIATYAKTRETYEAYKRSGYSKKFFEAHREELQLHKAAKEYFNAHKITKLPKMKDLSEEYGRILEEKRKEYAEYKEAKASMQDYLIARQNLETILGAEGKEKEERKDRDQQQK